MARLERYADSLQRSRHGAVGSVTRPSSSRLESTALLRSALPSKTRAKALSVLPDPTPPPADAMLWGENAILGAPKSAPARSAARWVEWHPRAVELRPALFGQFTAVLACILAVVAFQRLDPRVASLAVIVCVAVAVAAARRHIPLTLWLTVGLVIGGVLGRFS